MKKALCILFALCLVLCLPVSAAAESTVVVTGIENEETHVVTGTAEWTGTETLSDVKTAIEEKYPDHTVELAEDENGVIVEKTATTKVTPKKVSPQNEDPAKYVSIVYLAKKESSGKYSTDILAILSDNADVSSVTIDDDIEYTTYINRKDDIATIKAVSDIETIYGKDFKTYNVKHGDHEHKIYRHTKGYWEPSTAETGGSCTIKVAYLYNGETVTVKQKVQFAATPKPVDPPSQEPEEITYKVVFDVNGRVDATGMPEEQSVKKGSKAVEPVKDPECENYLFMGWTTTPEGTETYDFDTEVTADLTLYAMWAEKIDDPVDPETKPETPETKPGSQTNHTSGNTTVTYKVVNTAVK